MYQSFREQLEWRDAELFIAIPGLLILILLNNSDKGICKHFFPTMFDEGERSGYTLKHLRRAYNLGKLAASTHQDYYSLVEREVLGLTVDWTERVQILEKQFDNLDWVIHKIKNLAMELQRHNPTEWNKFLDVALA